MKVHFLLLVWLIAVCVLWRRQQGTETPQIARTIKGLSSRHGDRAWERLYWPSAERLRGRQVAARSPAARQLHLEFGPTENQVIQHTGQQADVVALYQNALCSLTHSFSGLQTKAVYPIPALHQSMSGPVLPRGLPVQASFQPFIALQFSIFCDLQMIDAEAL